MTKRLEHKQGIWYLARNTFLQQFKPRLVQDSDAMIVGSLVLRNIDQLIGHMQDCEPSEVDVMFSQAHTCVDCDKWEHWSVQPNTVTATGGLVDSQGVSSGLYVELAFKRSLKTKSVTYKFTVFRKTPWGPDRVYQLDVTVSDRRLKAIHDMPHEHWGAQRIVGDASWSNWSYDEALDHFCKRTAIAFDPPPIHPEHFSLEG